MAEWEGRKGRPWRRMCAEVYRTYGPVCWICHSEIDMTLPAIDRWSKTVHHLKARALGGSSTDINNLRPAHRYCNSRVGTGEQAAPRVTIGRW